MKIGLDMDGVLITNDISWAAYYDDFLDEHNHSEKAQTPFPTWNYIYDLCPVCFENYVKDPDALLKAEAMPGVQKGLQSLSILGDLHVVSHRETGLTETAINLLKNLDIYHYFTKVDWSFKSKLETCRLNGISILVDDGPKNLQELIGTEITPIAFDWPYNRGVDVPLRAYSWDEVPNLVQKAINERDRT